MNALPPQIPENAPFTPEQRVWLNGFFAGFLSARDLSDLNAAAGEIGLATRVVSHGNAPPMIEPTPEDDDAPWHDPTLGLDERMKLAAGKSLNRRLRAAMGQLDCGQCGSDCAAYAKALASGLESAVNLCVPGGKPTSRMVKALLEEATVNAAPKPTDIRSRFKTFAAKFLGAAPLTSPTSEKDVRHVEIDLSGTGLSYEVGDSLGIVPQNCPELVDQVLAAIGAAPDERTDDGKSVRDLLLNDRSLGQASDALFAAMGLTPDRELEALDVLELLMRYPDRLPRLETFVAALDPLHPRLYSIASSPRLTPGKVDLTVAAVRYTQGDRQRLGVASTFLSDRLTPGAAVTVYIQKAHNFALPKDDSRSIIMVGPGTGIAPFRAFLQERKARGAKGDAWLFFGDRHEASDFLYKDELKELLGLGVLTRMNTAFSRDRAEKIYVQHRMLEEGESLWRWLEQGAHFYVCGDAGRMAADVDAALHTIVEKHGRMNKTEARDYVAHMKRDGRYQRDVY